MFFSDCPPRRTSTAATAQRSGPRATHGRSALGLQTGNACLRGQELQRTVFCAYCSHEDPASTPSPTSVQGTVSWASTRGETEHGGRRAPSGQGAAAPSHRPWSLAGLESGQQCFLLLYRHPHLP